METQTLEQLYRRGRAALAAAPTAAGNSPQEAAFLFEHVFGLDRKALLAQGALPADPQLTQTFEALLGRRLAGEPLQYLLGEWEFFGLPFRVGPGVLIPRPETELLVDLALAAVQAPSPLLLDLCSGSGCIPIALGHQLPHAQVWGVELSPTALAFFQENLLLNAAANVAAVAGDIFALPPSITCRHYDLITSNPPYIPHSELAGLQAEVLLEPALALDGGEDGLAFYRALPALCRPLLAPGGTLLLEVGDRQGRPVKALLEASGYLDVTVHPDLSGMDRVVLGHL